MGSSASKPRPEETPEQRRRRNIERYGVLIPPVFVVASENSDAASRNSERINCNAHQQEAQQPHGKSTLSAHDRLPLSPSLVEYLRVTQFGHGLLKDFMTPGMWVSAGGTDASRTATTTVRASLPLASSQGGHISFVSSPTSSRSRVELLAGTEGPMHLFATHQLFPKGYVFANTNSSGSGYLGGQVGVTLDRTKQSHMVNLEKAADGQEDNDMDHLVEGDSATNSIHVRIGSWVPLQWNSKSTLKRSNIPQSHPSEQSFTAALPHWMRSPQHVHGYVSVDMLGSTTAVETKWNTDTLETEVSKYFSIRLDGPVGGLSSSDGDDGATTHNNHSNTPSSPPLWLTMTSNSQASAINISQLLSFDRINLNPLDARAPKVRNTFGWTVQVEKPSTSDSDLEPTPSQASVAAAWQYNRVLAFKLVGTSQSAQQQPGASIGDGSSSRHYTCTLGVLLKRWRQPRITCSFLGRYDFQTQTPSFVGIGLELETDGSTLLGPMGAGGAENFYTPPGAQVSDDGNPETKAALG